MKGGPNPIFCSSGGSSVSSSRMHPPECAFFGQPRYAPLEPPSKRKAFYFRTLHESAVLIPRLKIRGTVERDARRRVDRNVRDSRNCGTRTSGRAMISEEFLLENGMSGVK
ncbi:hypothetical protein KM043_015018 [Ampulex compressa]|nr:hypothetical protein KM043_015018 [Ampulex compressa]